jgi:hypothetical protein
MRAACLMAGTMSLTEGKLAAEHLIKNDAQRVEADRPSSWFLFVSTGSESPPPSLRFRILNGTITYLDLLGFLKCSGFRSSSSPQAIAISSTTGRLRPPLSWIVKLALLSCNRIPKATDGFQRKGGKYCNFLCSQTNSASVSIENRQLQSLPI